MYRVGGRVAGLVSAVIFSTFTPVLYLGSLGLHFHSSMFFYLLSLVSFVMLVKNGHFLFGVILSLSMTASYITYTSSYITAPMILLFSLLALFCRPGMKFVSNIITSFIMFIFALTPFIVYAVKINNFFVQRINQVNLFSGSWRQTDEMITKTGFIPIVLKHSSDALKSLIMPDIGGMGDYWYGHRSLFEPFGFMLFILGILIAIYLIVVKKRLLIFMLFFTTLTVFMTGMILTTHPPPFHRISIIYPFMAGLMSLPIITGYWVFKRSKIIPQPVFRVTLIVMVCLFSVVNILHARSMIIHDAQINSGDILKAERYLKSSVPEKTPIFIAAFPANAFGKELFFRIKNRCPIKTAYLSALPETHDRLVLFLHRPDQKSIHEVLTKYPGIRLISTITLRDYALFDRVKY
jgi:hypothetical protein